MRRLLSELLAAIPKGRGRLILASACFVLVYGAIIGRLVQMGVSLPQESVTLGNAQAAVSAARPDILDRNGEILATDIKFASLYAEPRRVVDFGYPNVKTRFFGVKTLSSDKVALDFKNIAEEVLAHLRNGNTHLTVRIEIEATDASGFDEAKIRTVSENAKTLKFDQAGFEDN